MANLEYSRDFGATFAKDPNSTDLMCSLSASSSLKETQNNNLFGYTLREARGVRSLRSIARAAGISAPYYQTLEVGLNLKTNKPSTPSLDVTLRLADALGMHREELLAIRGVESPDSFQSPETHVHSMLKAVIRRFNSVAQGQREKTANMVRSVQLQGSQEELMGLIRSGVVEQAFYSDIATELSKISDKVEQKLNPQKEGGN